MLLDGERYTEEVDDDSDVEEYDEAAYDDDGEALVDSEGNTLIPFEDDPPPLGGGVVCQHRARHSRVEEDGTSKASHNSVVMRPWRSS